MNGYIDYSILHMTSPSMHRKLTKHGKCCIHEEQICRTGVLISRNELPSFLKSLHTFSVKVENCTMLSFMAVNNDCLHRSAFNDFDSWFHGTLLRMLRMLCEFSDWPPGDVTRNQRMTFVTLPPITYGN